MPAHRLPLPLVCSLIAAPIVLLPRPIPAASYAQLREQLARERGRWAAQLRRDPGRGPALRDRLLIQADRVLAAWRGTRWGRGRPQAEAPGPGKINCGMFVARVLGHLGFRFDPWKLNRQAALDIIRTFVPRATIRSFSDVPVRRFVAAMRAMGPGLYLVGLDLHVGFLRVRPDGSVRHIHASAITGDVADEPALQAETIVASRLRVVGKLLQPVMLRAWVRDRRFHVHGNR